MGKVFWAMKSAFNDPNSALNDWKSALKLSLSTLRFALFAKVKFSFDHAAYPMSKSGYTLIHITIPQWLQFEKLTMGI